MAGGWGGPDRSASSGIGVIAGVGAGDTSGSPSLPVVPVRGSCPQGAVDGNGVASAVPGDVGLGAPDGIGGNGSVGS
ncbi:hypothetical protein GCM10009789_57320 [Kribbella sancticallisti]|uniref:Uncharacterized protein n=1 Tax=Kribbella sancticallisti TaxID=460087 RepID=A0ABN2E458_9ACTN